MPHYWLTYSESEKRAAVVIIESQYGVDSLTVSARGIRPGLDWQVGKDSSWGWSETFAGWNRPGNNHASPEEAERAGYEAVALLEEQLH
jgi:hypothetical protein